MGSAGHVKSKVFFFTFLACAFLLLRGLALAETVQSMVTVDSVEGKRFGFPCDVAVDSRGFFYVLDTLNKSVSIIGPRGKFAKSVLLAGGDVKKPEGIDVKYPGVFVIADSGNRSIIEFDVSGKKIQESKIAGSGRIVDVAVYGKTLFALDGEKGHVYVLEGDNSTIRKFGRRGDHAGEFKSPFRIFIDKSGKVFISDVMNSRVQIMDLQGKIIGEIRRFGLSYTAFIRPGGVSSDGFDTAFFTDMVSGFIFSYDMERDDLQVLKKGNIPVRFLDPVSIVTFNRTLGVVDQRGQTFTIMDY